MLMTLEVVLTATCDVDLLQGVEQIKIKALQGKSKSKNQSNIHM